MRMNIKEMKDKRKGLGKYVCFSYKRSGRQARDSRSKKQSGDK